MTLVTAQVAVMLCRIAAMLTCYRTARCAQAYTYVNHSANSTTVTTANTATFTYTTVHVTLQGFEHGHDILRRCAVAGDPLRTVQGKQASLAAFPDDILDHNVDPILVGLPGYEHMEVLRIEREPPVKEQ
jgi:hypothetical protein